MRDVKYAMYLICVCVYFNRYICERFLCLMKPKSHIKSSLQKVLDVPVNLGQMAANLQHNTEDVSSIWVINRDDNLVSTHRR